MNTPPRHIRLSGALALATCVAFSTVGISASAAEDPGAEPKTAPLEMLVGVYSEKPGSLGSWVGPLTKQRTLEHTNGEFDTTEIKIWYTRQDGTKVDVPYTTDPTDCSPITDPSRVTRCLGMLPDGEKIILNVDPETIPEGWHWTAHGPNNWPWGIGTTREWIVGRDSWDGSGDDAVLYLNLAKMNVDFRSLGGAIGDAGENVSRVVKRDNTVDFPADPVKEGFDFLGWYSYVTFDGKDRFKLHPNDLTPTKDYQNADWAINADGKKQWVWTPNQLFDRGAVGDMPWNTESYDSRAREDKTFVLRAQWGVGLTFDLDGGEVADGATLPSAAKPITYAPESANVTEFPIFDAPEFTLPSATDVARKFYQLEGWKVLTDGKPSGELLAPGSTFKPEKNTTLQAQWLLVDADFDGVIDPEYPDRPQANEDLCLGTPKGAEVDANGCAVGPTIGNVPAINGTKDKPIDPVEVPVNNPGMATDLSCTATGLPAGLTIKFDAAKSACVISGTPTVGTEKDQKFTVTVTYTHPDGDKLPGAPVQAAGTVNIATPAPAKPAAGNGTLPQTGAEVMGLAGLSLALLTAGGVLVGRSRKSHC